MAVGISEHPVWDQGNCENLQSWHDEALKAIPRNMLEMDGPYFPLHKDLPFSSPHLLGFVAEIVVSALDTSKEEVLRVTWDNTVGFYGSNG